jgi:superfamily I DNA/RNA helicase
VDGADNTLFSVLQNDFGIVRPITLTDNHRCPKQAFALARSLVRRNAPQLWQKDEIVATHESAFPVRALNFGDEMLEADWLLDDMRADRDAGDLQWAITRCYTAGTRSRPARGDAHRSGIPCRLVQGRAVADDR